MSTACTDGAQLKTTEDALDHSRYAIYYAPELGSPLDKFGQAWLGRDTRTGNRIRQPEVVGVYSRELQNIVSPATLYGFHGTLKPPFFLSVPELKETLVRELKTFAAEESPFLLPRLVLAHMGRFLVLQPERTDGQINQLSERCVRRFDSFRRPPSAEELNGRCFLGLNSSQEKNLIEWGYPYVMDQFKFHLTLTGPIIDVHLSEHLFNELERQLEGIDLSAIRVASICLFVQTEKDQPFMLHSRYQFGAA